MFSKGRVVSVATASVLLLCCVGLASGQCLVDASISEEDVPKVEQVISMLDPIKGTKLTVGGPDGSSLSVGICTDAGKGLAGAAVVESKGTNNTALGMRNRTTAVYGVDWLEVIFLSSSKYSSSSGPCAGKQRSARIMLLCDQDKLKPSSLELVYKAVPGEGGCYTLLSGGHSVACSHPRTTGLGGFSILLILIVVAFGCYFLFGVAYLRLIKGAKGVEQVPHRLFWCRLGNSFADCVGTLCRCDRFCGAAGEDHPSADGGLPPPGGYTNIPGGVISTPPTTAAPYQQGSDWDEELLAPNRAPTGPSNHHSDAPLIQP
uniref:Cation-dependent mannose-6-phosphate receptor-like n=1 Tax=Hirondellea gigas TaxID=1518452 RepID=A0A2P2I6V1_9CRUS